MPNPFVRFMVSSSNILAIQQSRSNGIQRIEIDPLNPEHQQRFGFNHFGELLHTASKGLQHSTDDQIHAFVQHQINQTTETPIYVDNLRAQNIYTQGHLYLYRSAWMKLSDTAKDTVKNQQNNTMRLLIRAFSNSALELPPEIIISLRQQLKSGANHRLLMRELRQSDEIQAYQIARWNVQASVTGDVMLGYNAIVHNVRQARYVLDEGRYIVDMTNPATREFHILDGSSMWIRVLDTIENRLMFAVIGTGKHRYTLIDASNNAIAQSIWHYMALVQQGLYDTLPDSADQINAHIASVHSNYPKVKRLYRMLCLMDGERPGAFARGLRIRHAHENGDGYSDPA